jgi:hypothetical protein
MKKHFICGMLALVTSFFVMAQDKRALLIGIDKYSPPENYSVASSTGRLEFRDLDGCINDAKAMG